MTMLSGPREQQADLAQFDISRQRGFLPGSDPLLRLRQAFDAWEAIALELPKLLMTDQLRTIVARMPRVDAAPLRDPPQLERAMMLLSYIGHAYVWGGKPI